MSEDIRESWSLFEGVTLPAVEVIGKDSTLDDLHLAERLITELHGWATLAEVISSERFYSMTPDQADQFIRGALTKTQYDMIVFRFGLNGEHWVTLDQLAKSMNITKERARDGEFKAIIRIRNAVAKLTEAEVEEL